MKILVIKRDKIGDMLLTTPMLSVLKQRLPGVELHVLANTYNGWVLECNPDVDRLWLYPLARRGFLDKAMAVIRQTVQIARLRAERFDWVIVAGGEAAHRANRRARLIAREGSRIVAYCDASRCTGISDPLPPPTDGHEVERILALLTPLGICISPSDIPDPRFSPPADWIESAKHFLDGHGLTPGSYVVIGIGTRKRKRQPSPTQVLRWAKALYEQHGLHTIFQWTPGRPDDPLYPGDDDVAEIVLAEKQKEGYYWLHPYRSNLNTGIGLIWLARTSLFPDSGFMHLAAASPGGVIGLFADLEHAPPLSVWRPLGEHVGIVVTLGAGADLTDEDVLAPVNERLSNPSCHALAPAAVYS